MNVDISLPDGKAKAFVLDGIAEYQKRLLRFCDLRLLYRNGPGRFHGQTERGSGPRVNVLAVSGAARGLADAADLSSEGFAAWMQSLMNRSAGGFVFHIAKSGECLADLCPVWDAAIRIAYVETDWDLTALILAEQIYRAFMIMNGRTYHK